MFTHEKKTKTKLRPVVVFEDRRALRERVLGTHRSMRGDRALSRWDPVSSEVLIVSLASWEWSPPLKALGQHAVTQNATRLGAGFPFPTCHLKKEDPETRVMQQVQSRPRDRI